MIAHRPPSSQPPTFAAPPSASGSVGGVEGLLADLGTAGGPDGPPPGSPASLADLAESGFAELCGPADRPPVPLATPLLSRVRWIMDRFDELAVSLGGRPSGLDGPALLVERAALNGLRRSGPVSVGGQCRMVRATDGVMAVNLPRDSDRELVPAWLEATASADPWATVASVAGRTSRAELIERAELVGLPVAALGPSEDRDPVILADEGGSEPRSLDDLRVVDLSAMWAGPLCGRLLAAAGAQVVKVESRSRPDALRDGDPALHSRLNGAKDHVVIDLRSCELWDLLSSADVVIDSSRPRAFAQLGVDVAEVAASGTTWVSITGYGRASDRVAFGDDAAVAGGAWVDGGAPLPWFVGDALADPLAGMYAALGALAGLAGGGALVDVSMSACTAHALGGEPPRLATVVGDG